jgi:extracellular factor (EF) 3-hydroxypalmitic acid methyl ester biosynthesis protein
MKADPLRTPTLPGNPSLGGPFLEACTGRIRAWVETGGPQPGDYRALDSMLEGIYRLGLLGVFGPRELSAVLDAFDDAFSPETLQGFSLRKPHGYAGDFEIIERMYAGYICPSERLANWDRFYQAQPGPQAVRNRKAYFLDLFGRLPRPAGRPLEVLNIASGPGTDMRELFASPAGADIRFDCVEQDPAAIAHAFRACREAADRVRFFQGNALTYAPGQSYDVVWSAGLFDYFEDGLFRRLLRRLLAALRPGGRLVIGNFSPANPSRAYMYLFDWPLQYRSGADLRRLAESCGVAPDRIHIEQEPLGINLFLHILRP